MGLLIAAFVLLAMFASGGDAIGDGNGNGDDYQRFTFRGWDVRVWQDHGQWKWSATPPQVQEWAHLANLFGNSDSPIEARAEALLNIMLKFEERTGEDRWWLFVDTGGDGFGPDGWGVLVDTIMEGEAFGDPATIIAIANMELDATITRELGYDGLSGTLKRVA